MAARVTASGGTKTIQRSSRRYKLFLRTEIIVGSERLRAHALDISETGALLHLHAVIDARSFRLVLGTCEHSVEVAWTDNLKLGVNFTPPLSSKAVDELLPFVTVEIV